MCISYKPVYQLVVVGLLLFTSVVAHAQNDDAINTFTPYSFYGVGDLALPGTAYNFGMGGIGVGVRTNRQINFLNPAALSAQDSLSFMIDFGLQNQNYYSRSFSANNDTWHNAASNSTNMHHIVLSFPVYKNMAIGLGLFPYSHVGYDIRSTEIRPEIIANVGNVYYTYKGEGGISQIALSLGARIGQRLSVGAGGQYYFGTIDRYTIVQFTTQPAFSSMVAGRSLKAGKFGALLGVQYEHPLEKDRILTVGTTYQFSTPVTRRVVDFAYTQTGSLVDTVRLEENSAAQMSIPQTISLGFSLRKPDVWMVGADYVYQDWKDTDYSSVSHGDNHRFSVTPSHLFKVGGEWTPNRFDFRRYLNRCTYRARIIYERTYMNFNDYQLKDVSAMVGMGFPVNRWNNNINFSAQVGQRGTTNNGLIREMYLKFTVSFSLYDIWFVKPRLE